MRVRLIAGLLAGAMALMTAAVPCAAMMAAPPEAGHECCDRSDQTTPQPKNDCELLCALGGPPATAADQKAFHTDDTAFTIPQLGRGATMPSVFSPGRVERPVPPSGGPPLFVVHAAFLI